MNKILIFEAYPSIRELLAEELTAEGNVTISVGRAESVSECAGQFCPDLIVLDLYVRGVIHWDLLEELKGRYPAIPILVFTAFRPQGIPQADRADAWVRKSFMLEELKRKIEALLGERKERAEIKEPILANDLNQKFLPDLSRRGTALCSN